MRLKPVHQPKDPQVTVSYICYRSHLWGILVSLHCYDQKKEKSNLREEVLFSTMISENSDHSKMNPLLCI